MVMPDEYFQCLMFLFLYPVAIWIKILIATSWRIQGWAYNEERSFHFASTIFTDDYVFSIIIFQSAELWEYHHVSSLIWSPLMTLTVPWLLINITLRPWKSWTLIQTTLKELIPSGTIMCGMTYGWPDLICLQVR